MPKCLECGNTERFITAYVEFQVDIYQGDKCIDNYSGDRERIDETYAPECAVCSSSNLEGEV